MLMLSVSVLEVFFSVPSNIWYIKRVLHQDPVPGTGIIFKNLHANFFGIQQTGDATVIEYQQEKERHVVAKKKTRAETNVIS